MIRSILFLFLCTVPVAPQTIREQTQKNLMAMTNITARQIVNGKSYRVAMFGGRQAFNREIPMPKVGLRPGSEWFSILQASQTWKLNPAGNHFTYSEGCPWFEISRRTFATDSRWDGWVPCEGEVFVDGSHITRITQRLFPNRMVKTVEIEVLYEWAELKEKRLVPAQMKMTALFANGRRDQIDVQWTDYKEFGANLIVKDVEADEYPRATVQAGPDFYSQVDPDVVQTLPIGNKAEPTSTQHIEVLPVVNDSQSATNLLTPIQGLTEKSVTLTPWKRFFRRILR